MTQARKGPALTKALEEIERRIDGRAAGEPLPSIRRLADQLGLSKSTIVDAYDRLASEGRVEARRGAGFYVGASRRAEQAARGPMLDRAVDPLWIARQAMEFGPGASRPGCGWLPPDWMPQEALRRALRALAQAPAAALADYAPPQGSPDLRAAIARRLAERDMTVTPEQIVLADSCTQAMDLTLRLLARPGDRVLVDDPCYFNLLATLRAQSLEAVGVKMTPSGPDLADMAEKIERSQARLYVTNAGPHNPTGASLSAASAHRAMTLFEAADVTVIEDDVFGEFEREPAPRLAALDGLRRVIALGGFSKTLSAAARCGYVAARRELIEPLIDIQAAAHFSGSALAQETVLRALQDGAYRKSVAALRDRIAKASPRVARALESAGLRLWTSPRAGLFLWARLPDGMDAAALARRGLTQDVVLAPGNVFSASGSAREFLRFNVAQSDDPRIFVFLKNEIEDWTRDPASWDRDAPSSPAS